jgi:hypothetical protein
VEALGRTSGRLTRDGSVVRVYSDSERAAAEAEETVLALLEETVLGYELWQERWDEERGEWEELAPEVDEEADPDSPVQPALDVQAVGWREAKLEVEITCASRDEVAVLADQLAALGLETSASDRQLRVPAADATDAGAITDWLWAVASPGADIEVREASFWDKLRP